MTWGRATKNADFLNTLEASRGLEHRNTAVLRIAVSVGAVLVAGVGTGIAALRQFALLGIPIRFNLLFVGIPVTPLGLVAALLLALLLAVLLALLFPLGLALGLLFLLFSFLLFILDLFQGVLVRDDTPQLIELHGIILGLRLGRLVRLKPSKEKKSTFLSHVLGLNAYLMHCYAFGLC